MRTRQPILEKRDSASASRGEREAKREATGYFRFHFSSKPSIKQLRTHTGDVVRSVNCAVSEWEKLCVTLAKGGCNFKNGLPTFRNSPHHLISKEGREGDEERERERDSCAKPQIFSFFQKNWISINEVAHSTRTIGIEVTRILEFVAISLHC